jgi:hypothetical protein
MGVLTYPDSRFKGNGRHRGPARWSRSTLFEMLGNQTYADTQHFGKSCKADDQLVPVEAPAIVSLGCGKLSRWRGGDAEDMASGIRNTRTS